jgi:hypothetical protein
MTYIPTVPFVPGTLRMIDVAADMCSGIDRLNRVVEPLMQLLAGSIVHVLPSENRRMLHQEPWDRREFRPRFQRRARPQRAGVYFAFSSPPSVVSFRFLRFLQAIKRKHNTVYVLVYFVLSQRLMRAESCFRIIGCFGGVDRCGPPEEGKGVGLQRVRRYTKQAVFA